MSSQYRTSVIPWIDWEEWNTIYQSLSFSTTSKSINEDGSRILRLWEIRKGCPPVIEASTHLFSSPLNENEKESLQYRLYMSAACVRLVNSFATSLRKNGETGSIMDISIRAGIPSYFVDFRHQISHQAIPSVSALKLFQSDAINLIYKNYWKTQNIHLLKKFKIVTNHAKNILKRLYKNLSVDQHMNKLIEILTPNFYASVVCPVILSFCLKVSCKRRLAIILRRFLSFLQPALSTCQGTLALYLCDSYIPVDDEQQKEIANKKNLQLLKFLLLEHICNSNIPDNGLPYLPLCSCQKCDTAPLDRKDKRYKYIPKRATLSKYAEPALSLLFYRPCQDTFWLLNRLPLEDPIYVSRLTLLSILEEKHQINLLLSSEKTNGKNIGKNRIVEEEQIASDDANSVSEEEDSSDEDSFTNDLSDQEEKKEEEEEEEENQEKELEEERIDFAINEINPNISDKDRSWHVIKLPSYLPWGVSSAQELVKDFRDFGIKTSTKETNNAEYSDSDEEFESNTDMEETIMSNDINDDYHSDWMNPNCFDTLFSDGFFANVIGKVN
eukprot:TRINITY_DN2933_c5_g3_i1.p1 TRINITY_DN2933_c5_g3~~TRINITY_DN2933_c5_g3_i1.p1  ORF type:complete len:555 (+),score=120.62 TRINITY_DN2933_c5_g3_i1:610-2274(+)